MKEKTCETCGKSYTGTGKYFCSITCSNQNPRVKELNRNAHRGMPGTMKGKHHTKEAKEKLRIAFLGRPSPMKDKKMPKWWIRKLAELKSGSKCPFWRGGKTKENQLIRSKLDYRLWRESVFERDKYTCQKCHESGVYLEAHHIKSFSQNPEYRFSIENGLTLCRRCHSQTDNYKSKAIGGV